MTARKLAFQRARNPEARDVRKGSLLRAAERLFAKRRYDQISTAAIAAEAGLAKGTLYLYFQSKEAVFLELLLESIEEWSLALGEELDKSRGRSAEAIAAIIASTLARRASLVTLLSLMHGVLEQNVSDAEAAPFKQRLARVMRSIGERLESRLTVLRAGDGVALLLRMHALAVGLAQMVQSNEKLANVLSAPELAPLRIDFRRELEAAIAAWLRGWRAR